MVGATLNLNTAPSLYYSKAQANIKRRQFNAGFYDEDDPMAMYQNAMLRRGGGPPRRFDEYFRCYPVVMLPGPNREDANHGGKVFLPPSALDKLTRLQITYPMLFELINGAGEGKKTHAGVLEFVAEEGKIYLPYWVGHLQAGGLVIALT
jgi:ubiquitin fusion degradation protein 1